MKSLESKAEQFTKIITDIATDSKNIVRTAIHFDQMRPIEDEDLPESTWREGDSSPAGFFCYEDAGMTSGSFLSSQSLRYKVTGDPEAKKNADRVFKGLCFIYDLGKEKVEGYFPKPYNLKISEQISRDQYIFVLTGLANYYDIADESTQEQIRRMMARMVEYWIGINYTNSYFGLPANSHLTDFMGSLFLGLVHYPCAFGGDEKFLKEYNRLFHEEKLGSRMPETLRAQFLRGETYDNAMYFRQNENAVMMKSMAIDHLWDTDAEHRELWEKSLRTFYNDELTIALDKEDGLTYWMLGFDPEKNDTFFTEPGIIEELTDPLNLVFIRYGGLRKTAGSVQVAYAATVIGDRLKIQESTDVAKLILEKLELDKFRHYTVPDESHIPPGESWHQKFLGTGYCSYWLWSYWLGRARKLW